MEVNVKEDSEINQSVWKRKRGNSGGGDNLWGRLFPLLVSPLLLQRSECVCNVAATPLLNDASFHCRPLPCCREFHTCQLHNASSLLSTRSFSEPLCRHSLPSRQDKFPLSLALFSPKRRLFFKKNNNNKRGRS